MKTILTFLALPSLASVPLSAQEPAPPGRDLVELFEEMQRSGATEDDLRRMLELRTRSEVQLPEGERDRPPVQLQFEKRHIQADAPADGWFIGLVVEPLPPFLREHLGLDKDAGVRVSFIAKDSPAAKAGIEVNDIVHTANGRKVSSLEQLKEVVAHAGRAGEQVKLGWIHQGKRMDAALQPQGPPPVAKRDGGDAEKHHDGDAKQPVPMERHMAELARRLERQQQEIQELRQELRRLRARLERPDEEQDE